ncbi:MAG: glycosyltransferase family 87 protein [Planctomycetota bacterium]
MTITASKPFSFERIAFAAIAAFTLAPVFLHTWWQLISLAIGGTGDPYKLTLASLVVTAGSIVAYIVFNKQKLLSSVILSSLIGLGIALLLGKNFLSILSMALVFFFLSLFISTLITWLIARLPLDLEGSAKQHKIRTAVFILLAVFTIGQTARVSTFMGDAKRADLSVFPFISFLDTHSCLTAYVHALKLAETDVENLYDVVHWPTDKEQYTGSAKELVKTGPYAPFFLDAYVYPPQFLLLPTIILALSDNFFVQRAIWFGFSALCLMIGFWIVANWVGEKNKGSALLLIPLLWSNSVILSVLQIGNIHHVIIVIVILAMIAFEQKKPVLGGALLAFSIVSKVSPGIFGIILLVQRRWRDAASTFTFGIIFTMLSIMFFGTQSLESFLIYELPRLRSGEAMGWLVNPHEILTNYSLFSLPFKLLLIGFQFDDVWGIARTLGNLYTLFILGLTVFIALQPQRDRYQKICLWLSVLTLATLQSPFAPGYVTMPLFWMLTLMANKIKNATGVVALVFIWIALSLYPPLATGSMAVIIGLFQQIVIFGFIAFILFPKPLI